MTTRAQLSGLFTDSDLAKLLERRHDEQLDRPIAESMVRQPVTISPGALLADAIEILSRNRISELPVVDEAGRPVGIIDITDVVGLAPFARSKPDVPPPALSVN